MKSSIHSFNFMATQRKKFEKLFWVLCFVLSIFGFEFMTREVYQKLKSTTITYSISSKALRIEEIPFPAVTFTPEFDHHFSKIENSVYKLAAAPFLFRSWFQNIVKSATNIRSVVEQFICYDSPNYSMEDVPFNYSSNNDFVAHLKAYRTSHILWFYSYKIFKWHGIGSPPFAEVLTRFGFGFSFNIMQANDLINFDK